MKSSILAEYENILNDHKKKMEGYSHKDEELEEKYKNYLDELQAESNEFNRLIENAFSDDFDEMLRNSVSLAKKAGVEEEKILDSKEKIDSFFFD